MLSLVSMLLAVIGAATATPVDVRVSLTPPEIPFHKQAVFTITAEAPQAVEVHLPDMRKKLGGADVYGDPQQTFQTLEDGRIRLTATYVLEAVKPGLYRIEPVEVTWGQDGRVVVAAPVLRVRELTPDEEISLAEFKPIALPAPPRSFWRSWMGWAALLLLALAAAVWFLVRRRRQAIESAVPRMPWEIARDRLRALGAGGLADAGEAGPFYVELSDILRRYIEDRFRLHAPERTTPEFLTEAAQTGFFGNEHQQLLSAVLRHADRVKFALEDPSPEQMQADFQEVARFIEETIPRMAAPAAQEAAA